MRPLSDTLSNASASSKNCEKQLRSYKMTSDPAEEGTVLFFTRRLSVGAKHKTTKSKSSPLANNWDKSLMGLYAPETIKSYINFAKPKIGALVDWFFSVFHYWNEKWIKKRPFQLGEGGGRGDEFLIVYFLECIKFQEKSSNYQLAIFLMICTCVYVLNFNCHNCWNKRLF